ncbi:MAG: sulfite exporter TauE/SafE family protein [Helicobacteraceae bacterium]|nr:sulfite exporter TauE/SafE family protein [Helicobacteraceae bacterium]
MEYLLFLCVGAIAGVTSGFFGIGGGLVVVPLCVLLGEGVKSAIALSSMQMTFSSILGSYSHVKNKMFNPVDYLWLGLGGVTGAALGAYLLRFISPHFAALFFLVMLIIGFARIATAKAEGDKDAKTPPQSLAFAVGFFVGVYAGMTGVGGGFLLVAIMTGFLGAPIKNTVAISLFFVLFVGSGAFLSYVLSGMIDFAKGAFLSLGALGGVQGGIWLASKTSPKHHKWAVVAVYIMMIVIMIYKIAKGEI